MEIHRLIGIIILMLAVKADMWWHISWISWMSLIKKLPYFIGNIQKWLVIISNNSSSISSN